MSLLVNLRHLEAHPLQVTGEASPEEIGLDIADELVRPVRVHYGLEVQKHERELLVQGSLRVDLDCECARCLKPFGSRLDLAAWVCLLPLEGEDRVPVANDCVDLTPAVREGILLELPQHPLCQEGCRGLPEGLPGKSSRSEGTGRIERSSSAWTELNKLKFEE